MKSGGISAVAYGIERINREVSCWMRGVNEDNDIPEIPFIATRGYDSVVWNRLYSKDSANVGSPSWKVMSPHCTPSNCKDLKV